MSTYQQRMLRTWKNPTDQKILLRTQNWRILIGWWKLYPTILLVLLDPAQALGQAHRYNTIQVGTVDNGKGVKRDKQTIIKGVRVMRFHVLRILGSICKHTKEKKNKNSKKMNRKTYHLVSAQDRLSPQSWDCRNVAFRKGCPEERN